MEKIYIVTLNMEEAGERFLSAHKTLQGAVNSINEDFKKGDGLNIFDGVLTDGMVESVNSGREMSYYDEDRGATICIEYSYLFD